MFGAGCPWLSGRARAPCACCCAGLPVLFPAGKMLRAAGAAGAGSAFPLPPQVRSLWLPGVCLTRLQQVKGFELDLLPCNGSVPAQPQVLWAAVLLLTNQQGRTWLIQSRALPDEDLVAASCAGSSVCGSCRFYLLTTVGTCVCILFLQVCFVICL